MKPLISSFWKNTFREEFKFDSHVHLVIILSSNLTVIAESIDLECKLLHKDKLKVVVTSLLMTPTDLGGRQAHVIIYVVVDLL